MIKKYIYLSLFAIVLSFGSRAMDSLKLPLPDVIITEEALKHITEGEEHEDSYRGGHSFSFYYENIISKAFWNGQIFFDTDRNIYVANYKKGVPLPVVINELTKGTKTAAHTLFAKGTLSIEYIINAFKTAQNNNTVNYKDNYFTAVIDDLPVKGYFKYIHNQHQIKTIFPDASRIYNDTGKINLRRFMEFNKEAKKWFAYGRQNEHKFLPDYNDDIIYFANNNYEFNCNKYVSANNIKQFLDNKSQNLSIENILSIIFSGNENTKLAELESKFLTTLLKWHLVGPYNLQHNSLSEFKHFLESILQNKVSIRSFYYNTNQKKIETCLVCLKTNFANLNNLCFSEEFLRNILMINQYALGNGEEHKQLLSQYDPHVLDIESCSRIFYNKFLVHLFKDDKNIMESIKIDKLFFSLQLKHINEGLKSFYVLELMDRDSLNDRNCYRPLNGIPLCSVIASKESQFRLELGNIGQVNLLKRCPEERKPIWENIVNPLVEMLDNKRREELLNEVAKSLKHKVTNEEWQEIVSNIRQQNK